MQKYDLLVVGGGMVGLTLALAVRKLTSLTVAIVEPHEPEALTDEAELRVSAINAASQQIFSELGVWQAINEQRLQAYRHMHVWDKDALGSLDFDIDDLLANRGREALGYIIENKVIRNALWNKAQEDSGITLITGESIQTIAMGDHEVFASFSQREPLMAKLVVGGDGANSWLRTQLDMPIAFRDYDNHAIVATVECEQGHQDTAWQVFLPEGPLAFLPLFNSNQCSIVWSTSPDKANTVNQLSPDDVAKMLTASADGKLGTVKVVSDLMTLPLTMRLAHKFTKDRAVLIGDAAHTIHPLAGQGVNLGLLDAVALAESLESIDINGDLTKALGHYSRWRRAGAADMVAAMEVIKQAFTPQHPLLKFARGVGMAAISNIAPIKELLINQALGLHGDLPKLAKINQ